MDHTCDAPGLWQHPTPSPRVGITVPYRSPQTCAEFAFDKISGDLISLGMLSVVFT